MKKKMRFQTFIKLFIFLLIIIGVGSFFGYKYYQDYLYKQSNEYKLKELGYTDDEVKLFLDKLSNDEESNLIERTKQLEEEGYKEFIPYFVKCEYFLYAKLDLYLEQIITKKQDFFHYKDSGPVHCGSPHTDDAGDWRGAGKEVCWPEGAGPWTWGQAGPNHRRK